MSNINKNPETQYAPMPGDAVYDYLCSKARGDAKVLGAKIIYPRPLGPFTPRKVISVQVEIEGAIYTYEYNYNKLAREIERGV